jgi:signal transduction histidine kinase
MTMMKVLVADGTETSRRELVADLGELTNVVIQGAVADLAGALRAMVDAGPELVITDVTFPDGEVVALIEAATRMARPPSVVVYTTSTDEGLRRRCLEAGASLFLARSVGASELIAVIADRLRRDRQSRRDSEADALQLLGRMTAGVAHDLNNYLAVLEVALGILRNRPGDATLWSRAQAALDGATGLTRNLLEHARGGSTAPAPVDLIALVRRCVGVLGVVIPSSILVVVDTDAVVPPVRGVHSELEQVVLNLVLNACDAMPHGGELRVMVRSPGPSVVRLEIADTGIGIGAIKPPEGARGPSAKTGRRGRGLGLGIVRAAVDRHRGVFELKRRQGGGTIAAVLLPAANGH